MVVLNAMSSIKIQESTKERLNKLGDLSSTYDSVINNLIDHTDECDKFWENKYP